MNRIELPRGVDALTEGIDLCGWIRTAEPDETLRCARVKNQNAETAGLDRRDYAGVCFTGCRFAGTDFSRCGFTDVVFDNCDLSGAHFCDAGFQRTAFYGCRAMGANFSTASLQNVVFENGTLEWASLDGCRLNKVRLTAVKAAGISFAGVEWKALVLEKTDLCKATAVHTPLSGLDLRSCDIGGLSVSDTAQELRGAVVNSMQAVELARLLGLEIKD